MQPPSDIYKDMFVKFFIIFMICYNCNGFVLLGTQNNYRSLPNKIDNQGKWHRIRNTILSMESKDISFHTSKNLQFSNDFKAIPNSLQQSRRKQTLPVISRAASLLALASASSLIIPKPAFSDESNMISAAATRTFSSNETINLIDFSQFKVPYNHLNLPLKDFLGKKATIIFNMKIDDPQTNSQFPIMVEIFDKYKDQGLNIHAFPTEQGWFEPDDDETCRLKAKEYYRFGDYYPNSLVFDKVDVLGPSAHPLFQALEKSISTPNGYSRITLNYEKFLLNADGFPVRRYPRKFSANDFEEDIKALLAGESLPTETPAFQKAWREAKREAIKSEYAFRYNYNYYNAPDSMYKYNPRNDFIHPQS